MAEVAWARFARRSLAICLVGAGLGVVADGPVRAEEYRFQADYRVTLNGLPIGRANLTGTFEGADYRLDGQGRLTGIAGALFEYAGSAAAAGRLRAGRPSPSAFSADASDGKRKSSVRMSLVNDGVHRINLDPPLKPHQINHPARVQVNDDHKRNIMDPMSALITPGGFDGESFDRSICNRTVPVFNGRERFDVKLEYAGIRSVESSQPEGYSGPVLLCSARYRPVAGHRTDRDEIQYVADKVVFDVMFAPVPDSDLVVPYRVSVSTPLGSGTVQATSLTAKGALSSRAAALR